MAGGGNKAVVAALLANTGIAITKFGAWALTQSASMLAESIHSLADAGNQVLLLVGAKRAKREADELHQFGFGRERYVYSFIVAIVLFSVGGLFALYEGYHKVHDPHGIDDWQWVPVAVLVAAIIMESFSFRTAIVEANKVRGHVAWARFIRNARSPGAAGHPAGGLRRPHRSGAGADRRRADPCHRQRSLRRPGLDGDRRAAGLRRDLPGDRDEVAAAGRVRDPRGAAEDRRRDRERAGRAAADPHQDPAPRPGGDPGRRQGRGRAEQPTPPPIAETIDAAERAIRDAEPMSQQIYLEPDIYAENYTPDERPAVPEAPSH